MANACGHALLIAVLALGSFGCSKKSTSTTDPGVTASSMAGPPRPASASASAARNAGATPSASARAAAAAATKTAVPAGSSEPISSGFVVDEIADVGPAAPAAATPLGVILISRSDELVLARLSPPLPESGAKPGKTRISTIAREPGEFAAFLRGPAVLDGHAYWISKTRLVRRRLQGGPVEQLAEAAREGTRVSTARAAGRASAAYIGQTRSGLVARLWTEGHGEQELSPEGSSANSVALVTPAPSELVAVSLEGRTAMTPVHARRIEVTEQGAPRLADDVVIWVGSSAQPLTELTALATPSDVWVFLAIERDITHFGLAQLHVGSPPSSNPELSWRDYPNGTDPAPVAAANVCGGPVVVFSQPSEARPHSPQELHLAKTRAGAIGASQVVARARAFSDVSMVALEGGALIAYVADRRTWALSVRCRGDSRAPGPGRRGSAKPGQSG